MHTRMEIFMRKNRNATSFAGLLAVSSLVLAACSSSDAEVSSNPPDSPDATNADASVADQTLRVSVQAAPPGGWDPTGWGWDTYTWIAEAAYDPLIQATEEGYAPALATDWEWVSNLEF